MFTPWLEILILSNERWLISNSGKIRGRSSHPVPQQGPGPGPWLLLGTGQSLAAHPSCSAPALGRAAEGGLHAGVLLPSQNGTPGREEGKNTLLGQPRGKQELL